MMNNTIAVTLGDINGIGLELLLKLFLKKNKRNFVLFTDIDYFKKYLIKNKIKIKTYQINKNNERLIIKKNHLNIYSYKSNSNEDNTIKSLVFSYRECLKKNYIGVVTLPLRKDLIINKIDKKFIGQTEYFQELDKKKFSNMILYHKKIIVSPLTTHISIKSVSDNILKKDFMYNKIINIYYSLIYDFKINFPKIIISGINPHAGENGKIGFEEKEISKVLSKLKKKGIIIDGPYSADSMLIKNNIIKYDCFIFMYHDQALIPFKYISKFSGVNFTSNLKIIRTSPDHGTAYNLRGSRDVSSKSLENCFKLVKLIYKNRKFNNETKKIIKSKFFNW